MKCSGKKGCKGKIVLDGKCCRHLTQQCSICLENVGSTNTIATKRLTCGHAYHTDCILNWFITSDECPVCRTKQLEDPLILFKLKVEDELRQKYKDAIHSFEREILELRLRPQFTYTTPPWELEGMSAMTTTFALFDEII
jgi:hypothetical protein